MQRTDGGMKGSDVDKFQVSILITDLIWKTEISTGISSSPVSHSGGDEVT